MLVLGLIELRGHFGRSSCYALGVLIWGIGTLLLLPR